MPYTVSTELENKYVATVRKPAEIYKIWNDYNEWFITSADTPIVYDGDTYQPAIIKRSGTQRSADMNVSKITIDVHYLFDEVIQYLATSPVDVTWVTINRVFRDQDPIEVFNYFVGTLSTVSFKGQRASIVAEGVEKMLRVATPKYRYQSRCNHKLYSTGIISCGLNKADWAVNEAVVSISSDGTEITVGDLSAYADGYFNLGYIQPPNSGPVMITNHVGDVLSVRYFVPELAALDNVVLYPGCDKTPATCRDKFNNLGNPLLDRFLGFIYIPNDNPCMWTNS
jgi:uncharacterized phage protein (TIGR02218 family)